MKKFVEGKEVSSTSVSGGNNEMNYEYASPEIPNPAFKVMKYRLHVPVVRFKKLRPDATVPTRGTSEAAGFDLYAAEALYIPPGEHFRVPTGIACAIPAGYVGLVKPRSSIFYKGGDSDGTVDSDYRGELFIQIRNVTRGNFLVEKGARYAQMVIVPYLGDSIEVDELDDTQRGIAGFGSTGK